MKLSIIVPVYNVEPYLQRCVDSILAQTFTDFELILVDDGSLDNCPAICDEYVKKDSRIIVVHNKNIGVSAARNTGLDIARGEYIGFVDSDDFIHPHMYERLFKALSRSKADIAMCNCKSVDKDGELFDKQYELLSDWETSGPEILHTIKDRMALNVHYIVVWNKIYARYLWEDLRFPVGRIHEDEYTAHYLYGMAQKVISIHDQLYYYRRTPKSIMNRSYDIRRFDTFWVFEDRVKYLLSHDYIEEAIVFLSHYYETLRVKYYLIPKNDETKAKLTEVRKTARHFLYTYLKKSTDIWTVKIATVIFMFCPSIYKKIWHKE